MANAVVKYFDSAVKTLEKFGLGPDNSGDESRLAGLLNDVIHVDEPSVVAIARVVRYTGVFDSLIREKLEEINVGNRYERIASSFATIRDDAKTLVDQLSDGRIDYKERASNFWMRLTRGSPHKRFEDIRKTFLEVTDETKKQLDNEETIMEAYKDFRSALKESEGIAYKVLSKQKEIFEASQKKFSKASEVVKKYAESDLSEKSRLELERDESQRELSKEEKRFQLLTDISENISMAYNVGEVLIGKLQQTHNVKDRLYQRAITFFETNRQIFSEMDAIYTSQRGLHEITKSTEAMVDGVNKGLEQIAELSGDIEKTALKQGYGATYNPESVKKLVDSVVNFQEESINLIKQYREESTKAVLETKKIVEEGKQRFREALERQLVSPL